MSPFVRSLVVGHACLLFPLLLAVSVGAESHDPRCEVLPPTIQVGALHDQVIELLRRSPTFARQCATIAAARRVRVTVVVVPPSELASAVRAQAIIERFTHGLIRARIELPAAGNLAELLPHELEHVIEQLEGLDLRDLSSAGDRGVYRVAHGVFETSRARDAGRAAAAEFYAQPDRVLALAAQTVRAAGARASAGTPRRSPGMRTCRPPRVRVTDARASEPSL